jgi:hypothetical protein
VWNKVSLSGSCGSLASVPNGFIEMVGDQLADFVSSEQNARVGNFRASWETPIIRCVVRQSRQTGEQQWQK